MSTGDTAVDKKEARRLATEKARSAYGTFIRVRGGEYDEDANVFRFPITIRRPRIINESDGDGVIDVRFYSEQDVGEIVIDGEDRSVTAPHREKVFRRIRDHHDEIEEAVQKALVSTAGTRFSRLPFLSNQYSPLEDIISDLLLDKQIPLHELEDLDEHRDRPAYIDYTEDLKEIELANVTPDRTVTAGDRLIQIYKNNGEEFDHALNDAMGVYFQNNLDQFDMIYRTLGPYLVLAGRYYQSALAQRELPLIHEDELRDAIAAEYSGYRKRRMLFKVSRYLIQLQEVGILQPNVQNGTRFWEGIDTIHTGLEDAAVEFDPIQELLESYS